MKLSDLIEVLRHLRDEKVPFLIAGGLAVVAHGHTRVTHDLDLVLRMQDEGLNHALQVLENMGFQPRLPVAMMDFADAGKRAAWIRDKGMQVFSLVSTSHPSLVIDIFAEAPFSFDEEWEQAAWMAFPDNSLVLPFVSLPTLLDMKRAADRPVDREDIAHLIQLSNEQT